jgi:hypothetical protein
MVSKSKRGKSPDTVNTVYSQGDYVLVYDDAEEKMFIIAKVSLAHVARRRCGREPRGSVRYLLRESQG